MSKDEPVEIKSPPSATPTGAATPGDSKIVGTKTERIESGSKGESDDEVEKGPSEEKGQGKAEANDDPNLELDEGEDDEVNGELQIDGKVADAVGDGDDGLIDGGLIDDAPRTVADPGTDSVEIIDPTNRETPLSKDDAREIENEDKKPQIVEENSKIMYASKKDENNNNNKENNGLITAQKSVTDGEKFSESDPSTEAPTFTETADETGTNPFAENEHLLEETKAGPISRADNHRAFQTLIEKNATQRKELLLLEEKLKEAEGKIKAMSADLTASRARASDGELCESKLELALGENLRLKSGEEGSSAAAYQELETAFLLRKFQESKTVEDALRNQVTLAADVKAKDDRRVETLIRRVTQLDKEVTAREIRAARAEEELAQVSDVVAQLEELVDAEIYGRVVEKAKGKAPLNGERRNKTTNGKEKDNKPGKTEEKNGTQQSKLCLII